VDRVMSRAVERGLLSRPERSITQLAIDEKGFGKEPDFATILTDLNRKCVHDLAPGRKAEDAEKLLLGSLTETQRKGVQVMTMDMSKAYIAVAKKCLPLAAVVFDRFHIAMLLNEAVDTTRKIEHRQNMLLGDESLKKTKYLWLEGLEDMSEERRERLEKAYQANAKLARTWMDKENFSSVFESTTKEAGLEAFEKWEKTVLRRRGLEPMKKAAATLRRHLDGVLAYIEHRATNALAEGINSLISVLKGAARGMRNFARFRVRVLFYHGKLDLLPA
jgi:transposase